MAAEDWERIKQVFSAALGIPAPHRAAYLELACAQRPDLRAAVEDLLAAHYDASQDFLERGGLVFESPWLFRADDRVDDRFRVIRPIARGAMGEVYEVHDNRLRLRVALKAIRPELVGDADTAERFRREVLVTREVPHPGICRVFDLLEHRVGPGTVLPEGTIVPCLTMQLLDGESLDAWLRTRRPMSPAEAWPLIRQIAEALQVLHDNGVVHRDLKPSNVMLVPAGDEMRAVLTDFGLAKPIDESLFETQVAQQGGAPFYMAPELFEGKPSSPSSDLYALGLLIDEMVTRPRAFSADSLPALMLQKLGDGPTKPSERSDDLPRGWERTILRCLARHPGDRFASATEVLASLTDRFPSPRRYRFPLSAILPARASRLLRLSLYLALTVTVALGAASVRLPQDALANSVLILPFNNLTGHPEYEYLCTGTAGELGRRLSRIPNWHVYVLRDPTAQVAPSQRATFSLRGHLQQAGESLRITVELTHTGEGTLLWAQNFEGTREGSLDLEDDLAAEAVRALAKARSARHSDGPFHSLTTLLKIEVPFGSYASLSASGTTNNAAFDAYMRGRYLFEERTLTSALAAIDSLQRAVRLDPNFAAAYAALADVQGVLMDLHYAPHAQLITEAERYASQAVALDPDLPDAQVSLAAVRQQQGRWPEADAAYRRAIELHPTFARAHRWYGGMLLQFGRFDEGLRLYQHALELDPYDYPSQSAYGHALFYAGRSREAATQLEQLIARKDLLYAHALLGQVYAHLGGTVTSRRSEYLQKALHESDVLRQQDATRRGDATASSSDYGDLVGALAWSYQGDRESAAPFVERLEAGHAEGRVSPSMLARVYAVQGRASEALDALEQAEAQHDRELMYLKVSPLFATIRNEQRFQQLVQRMHLGSH